MKLLFNFLLLLTSFAGLAGAQRAATATDPAITEFDVNGLKVIFKKRVSSPTLGVGLFVRGGVRNMTAENAGIENFAMSVAMEGSKNYPNVALRQQLARTGSSVGGAAGTDFSVLSLASTTANFADTWKIFTDLVRAPTFKQADVDRVRDGILVGLRGQAASPDSALGLLEAKVITAGHPYAVPASGTVETISELTPADLQKYYTPLIESSRLLLVVVGDYDADALKKLVEGSFSDLPKGTFKDTAIAPISFAKATLDITERSIPTNYIKGVFLAPSLTDPDYYAMRVAMAILQSRVYQQVRVVRNLSYAPNAEMNETAANTANIYVTAVDANQAVQVMLDIVADMRANKVADDEFEGIPGYFLTTHYIDQETDLAQVRELATYELIGGGWQNSLKFTDGINSVTPADVQRVSAKYMKNIRFVVVGDPKAIDRSVFLPQ